MLTCKLESFATPEAELSKNQQILQNPDQFGLKKTKKIKIKEYLSTLIIGFAGNGKKVKVKH